MRTGQFIFLAWCTVVYFISAHFFSSLIDIFANEIAPWQQRLIDTNIEYAIALFFLIFNILWQGIAVDAFSKKPFHILLVVYRAFIFPIMFAGVLIAQLPFHFNFAAQIQLWNLVFGFFWLVIAGDPIGWAGQYLSKSFWFQENIFREREESVNLFFHGLRGRGGILILHVGVLLLFCIGFLRAA